jgi:imidazole glycerol-phosphate synthase subunit HisH
MRATILDAGVGNIGNLVRALEHLGATADVTTEPARVRVGRCLLLPGVGAFRPPRERLRDGLEDGLREAIAEGAWLLGICVGYQLLFESSSEFAESARPTDGLALLHGRVVELPGSVPRPHIGWNALHDLAPHPLLHGIAGGDCAYFVHGFAPDGVPRDEVLAACTHGRAFAAVAGRGRVLGTQFHPEKSGAVGLRLLRNFLDLCANGGAP